jgi:pimeloyl-ACP methyl ester carboxylesterase
MTAKTRSKPAPKRKKPGRVIPPGWQDPLAPQQPLVSGRWLLRALSIVVGTAAACSYLTLCLLFYQGQWQVVFQPSRTITSTPATVGLKYDEVRFDYTGTGISQLAGWWIPADPAGAHANRTLLYLHDGHGSLSDSVNQLKTLHSLGIDIFAFDYRGFGKSAETHPSEQHVYEDTDAAWSYLTDIRHVDPKSIVLDGEGLGAVIATEAAIRHPQSPALILENPAPPALSLIEADHRTHLLPAKWLFHDRFEIEPKLAVLGVKLSPTVDEFVKSGKPSPSPVIVTDENQNRQGPRLLLLLGKNAAADPHSTTAIENLLSTR